MEIAMPWLLLRRAEDDPISLLSLKVDYFPIFKDQLGRRFFKKIHLLSFISIVYLFFLSDRCSYQV